MPSRSFLGIEHFQGSAAGIDLVVMSEFGEAFEDGNSPSFQEVAITGARQDRATDIAILPEFGPGR